MLTTEELQAIRERAEAATDGKWAYNLLPPSMSFDRKFCLGSFNGVCEIVGDINKEADAEFIAAARQDVPKLLAEVERLNKVLHRISVTTMSMGYVGVESMARDLKRLAWEAIHDGK
ncbi:ead/Ea22-like family protein [Peribacillus butanolivorans]|uniref:Ead/Ea22-like family protein n=1 Tax=Peribacillus butanolivorans TaxID=421767 RepID=A0ABM6XNS6_9BACI|nr:ead/Ea22-like family protein [Peribacillus butanolivorans]AXN39804.1 hypothetical protein DTO10_16510 [Peribacillus butanolivorans]